MRGPGAVDADSRLAASGTLDDATRRREFFPQGRKKLVLVASYGGHLAQLMRLAEREGVHPESVWVTSDSPQSRAISSGRMLFVDYVAPRDLRSAARAYRKIASELDPASFDGVLTTGPAVGVAALAWARRHRLPGIFVESISRTEGPSLSGRLVRALGLARTYTQHQSWSSARWPATIPTLQSYAAPRSSRQIPQLSGALSERPLRIFVTLGTIRPYRFDRVVDRVQQLLIPGDHITWQLGQTSREGLPGTVYELIDTARLLEEASSADVVITHSGVGTILQLLEAGVSPIVLPRRKEFGEHVDDHQLQIWQYLRDSGVAFPVDVEDLTRATMNAAAATRSERSVSK